MSRPGILLLCGERTVAVQFFDLLIAPLAPSTNASCQFSFGTGGGGVGGGGKAKKRAALEFRETNERKKIGTVRQKKTKIEEKRKKIFGAILPLFWTTFPVIFGTLGYFSCKFLALSSTFETYFWYFFLLLSCFLPGYLALFYSFGYFFLHFRSIFPHLPDRAAWSPRTPSP